ncbi:hypothetical protein [Sphingomonas montanisoli]|uniref:Uncharacterized protein n=1 Tax=Sphingomonas montanisoli TaxID=2606412 RepID=A0A5D9CCC9_9SPHN|nr:hypothetical protein [Sphingomonas montanisoli]TZG27745.1 hypothetical protein FYJ91_09260 [Sphingomonas montanisoli]
MKADTAFRNLAAPGRDTVDPAALLDRIGHSYAALRALAAGGAFDRLFAQLNRMTMAAADLLAGIGASDTLTLGSQRDYDAQQALLLTELAQVEAIVGPSPQQLMTAEYAEATVRAAEALSILATLRADTAALHTALVDTLRRALFPGVTDPVELALSEVGFADPISAAARFREWDEGRRAVLATSAERRAMKAVLPQLLQAIAHFPDPDAVLAVFDEVVGRQPAGVALFSSFEARPSLLLSMLGVIGRAPVLARHLVVQPQLVGRMIDSSVFAPVPKGAEVEAELGHMLAGTDAHAGALRMAEAVNAHRFALGLQTLEATADLVDIAQGSTDLAEATLSVVTAHALAEMEAIHGKVPGSEFLILGLGRFGGSELTHRSDLDLVYLFTGDCRTNSTGRRPLDANEYFSRVARRVSTMMATMTTLGPLYQVDTRLRPWGSKGLLACSVDCFDAYHRDEAWTWEHMALTRARPVFGSDAARETLKRLVTCRLRSPRNRATLIADALKMRGDIARNKAPRGAFDVKLVQGGLVDLEFAVHTLQLNHHVGLHPRLRAAIRSLVVAGLADRSLIGAHDLLSRLLIALRTVSPHAHEPAPERREAIAQACGLADWDALVVAYGDARAVVSQAWQSAISSMPTAQAA